LAAFFAGLALGGSSAASSLASAAALFAAASSALAYAPWLRCFKISRVVVFFKSLELSRARRRGSPTACARASPLSSEYEWRSPCQFQHTATLFAEAFSEGFREGHWQKSETCALRAQFRARQPRVALLGQL
jgi:hypothetical protein